MSALEKYLDLLAHKNPGLRIIEVGAGTGSTTGTALNAITLSGTVTERFSLYSFTDVSPSLIATAQETFGIKQPKMRFQLFDIEKSPEEQGVEANSYDVVVAASVLHASTNITNTLRNVRSLLKVGGKLLFMENVTLEHVKMGFAFGLLPGWWLGKLTIPKS